MTEVVKNLIDLLKLDDLGDNHFRGLAQDLGYPRLFGGHVIGQALSAASQTLEDKSVHSLHGYFLRPGDAHQPIDYAVECVRDGRSFSVRRVVASQFDKPILAITASFQVEEDGMTHQVAMPNVPGPEFFEPELKIFRAHANEIPERVRSQITADRPIEYRIVEAQNPFRPRNGIAKRHMWIRSTSVLPDDPIIHQSMLAYTTDYGFLETALMPHGISIVSPNLTIASLDHAIWFHRPFRLDDWLLYVADSPTMGGSRGYVRGQIFDRNGNLVASTSQEGLIRHEKGER
jgi:acyl-CoA thioesterase-2